MSLEQAQMIEYLSAQLEAEKRKSAKLREQVHRLRLLDLHKRAPSRYLPWRGYVS